MVTEPKTETVKLKVALERLMGKKGSIPPTQERLEKSKKQGEELRKRKKEADIDAECLWTVQFNATPVIYSDINGEMSLESD